MIITSKYDKVAQHNINGKRFVLLKNGTAYNNNNNNNNNNDDNNNNNNKEKKKKKMFVFVLVSLFILWRIYCEFVYCHKLFVSVCID